MATEKFSNEKTVKLETSKISETSNTDLSNFLPKKATSNILFKRIFYGLILIITILTLCKIPYCGSYVDGYIFEFIIGTYSKFFVYAFLLIFSIAKILDFKFMKYFTNKNFVIGWMLLIICSILVSAIAFELIDGDRNGSSSFTSFTHFPKLFTDYMDEFKSNIDKYINKFNPFVWSEWLPGLFGNLITDLWGILLSIIAVVVAIVFLIFAVLFLINKINSNIVLKFKKWIVKHFNLSSIINKDDELEVHANDVKPDIYQKSDIKNEAAQIAANTPPISFLSETSVDNFLSNKTDSKLYGDTITNFLHRFDSIVHLQKIVVAPLYSEISYEVEKDSVINDIFLAKNEILSELKLNSFNILYKNKVIRFEIPNKLPSKISLKSIYSILKQIETNNCVVGIDENLSPILIDIIRKPNIALIGTRGSGVSMLMTTMLTSLAYTNSPKQMSMVILSTTNDKSLKCLGLLPHLLYPIQTEQLEITKILLSIQDEINKRESMFQTKKCRSLENYNALQGNDFDRLKRIVVSIINFSIISKISLQNHELITDILKRGPKYGVCSILLTNVVDQELLNEDIYKKLDAKLLMKLEFEQESIQLIDSKRAIELFGNGDGYYFDSESKQHIRFQACYMNIEELTQVIRVMETYYSVKSKLV